MNNNTKTACFTGPRPKNIFAESSLAYQGDSYRHFVKQLVGYIEFLYKERHVTRFITGGAQGFDQMAFWAVKRFRDTLPAEEQALVQNIIVVPFRGQERNWAETGCFSQKEYHSMLRNATQVIYLNQELYDRSRIVKALFDRNHYMLKESDYLIALYANDSWRNPDTKGGTAECMRYAERLGKHIEQILYSIDTTELVMDKVIMFETT